MPRDPRSPRRPLRRATALVVAAAAIAAAVGVVSVRRARSFRHAPAGTRFGFTEAEFRLAAGQGQGLSVDVAFGDAPVPAGARELLRALAPAGLRTVITRWAPADARPGAYPDDLPFLAGREVHTAEHVPNRLANSAEYASAAGRSARWPFATPVACDSASAQLTAFSAADGWRRVDTGSDRVDPRAVRYARAGWTRTFLVGDAERARSTGDNAAADRWCTVEMADRPAGHDGAPTSPYFSWPYWWDPASPATEPPAPQPGR